MTVPSPEELDSFKYSDLQNLAKSLGLRANLKAEKLLRALKAHLKEEAGREKEHQAEGQTSASSCGKPEIEICGEEQAAREPAGQVTKRRRRRKTAHGNPDPQQDLSEITISESTEFQSQEEQEDQIPGTTAEAPPAPRERQGEETAVSSGGSGTKDFKKLHEAHFKEMESIDQYVERKRKHFKEHNPFSELKKQSVGKGGAATPVPLRGRPPVACTPAGQQPAGRSTLCLKGSAKRSTLSATKMNVRFSAATKDNEHKRSLTKTPARKSPHVTVFGSTPKGQAVLGTPKLKTTKGNFAVISPFKLTTIATQTPVSNKKPVFDLKASLSRPLNYEPHKGKLKPWGQSKENNSLNEHGNRVSFHKKSYKQPRLQTREEQRKKHEQERKEKKAKVLGARRGLSVVKD
ncbi:nucleolar and spindle-associated protein 1 isoform X3 [Oryctolagus cuniculus]|uniref:nucleolar and spindle-associated protein 1 isoform X3 n=1 Tax=Oryctolagus cuniculus TaxID=9986 RepID=UPI0038798D0F